MADEHNALPTSTRKHVKLDKFVFETHDYRIYYVKTDLRHQYGISVAESQTFGSVRNVPRGEERGETDVFAGYALVIIAFSRMLPRNKNAP